MVVVLISGSDIGEHASGPFKEFMHDVEAGRFDLFIDARATCAATIDVSSEWAHWLTTNRAALSSIEMLTGSSFIQLTAKFVRDYAALGEIMRIYTAPAVFDRILAERLERTTVFAK